MHIKMWIEIIIPSCCNEILWCQNFTYHFHYFPRKWEWRAREREIAREKSAFFFLCLSFIYHICKCTIHIMVFTAVWLWYILVHKNEYIHSNWPHRSAQQNRHLPAYETACRGMLNAYWVGTVSKSYLWQ